MVPNFLTAALTSGQNALAACSPNIIVLNWKNDNNNNNQIWHTRPKLSTTVGLALWVKSRLRTVIQQSKRHSSTQKSLVHGLCCALRWKLFHDVHTPSSESSVLTAFKSLSFAIETARQWKFPICIIAQGILSHWEIRNLSVFLKGDS